jgi:Flp pilus assembly pilin Flp
MRRQSTGQFQNQKGQGLTEYIIILALVAIAAIGIVNIFGNQLRYQFHSIVSALSGHGLKVKDLSGSSRKQTNKKTLSDYATSK